MVAPAPTCRPQVFACAMRIAQLDGSGVPQPGANMLYVTNNFSQVQTTPQYEAGDEVKQKNACGAIAYDVKGPPSYLRSDIQITLVLPDPQLMQLLGGGPVVNITADGRVGGSSPSIGVISTANQNGVSIEVWAKQFLNGVPDPTWPFAWWAFPKVTNMQIGQMTQDIGGNLPVITGEAYENPNWFNGPGNDWPTASPATQSWQWIPSKTMPTPTCGYLTLAST